jgi:hypothetical protein
MIMSGPEVKQLGRKVVGPKDIPLRAVALFPGRFQQKFQQSWIDRSINQSSIEATVSLPALKQIEVLGSVSNNRGNASNFPPSCDCKVLAAPRS